MEIRIRSKEDVCEVWLQKSESIDGIMVKSDIHGKVQTEAFLETDGTIRRPAFDGNFKWKE